MNMTMLELVGSTDQQQLPAGWTLATPLPRVFYSMLKERKLALDSALAELRDLCTELKAPEPSEFCFLPPFRATGWQDFTDSVDFETTRVCSVVAFLVDVGLAEARHYEGREGDVLTVMPWRIHASVLKTMEHVGREQKRRAS